MISMRNILESSGLNFFIAEVTKITHNFVLNSWEVLNIIFTAKIYITIQKNLHLIAGWHVYIPVDGLLFR